MGAETRRFACTACGACCTRGPEMELSEATALADTFLTSLVFKVHSLPLDERSEAAARWWQGQDGRIPLRPALEERRRHLAQFATRKRSERARNRQTFLELSAIVDDHGLGRCPALARTACAIHAIRPLTCRTVPLHYSRAPSTLRAYLDDFIAMPGHRCDTSLAAPAILDGNQVLDPQIRADRARAVELAKADRRWKEGLVVLMEDERLAEAAGLPNLHGVIAHSESGFATMVPMIVAWRVAESLGILPPEEVDAICAHQLRLAEAEMQRTGGSARDALDTMALYQREIDRRRTRPNAALLVRPIDARAMP